MSRAYEAATPGGGWRGLVSWLVEPIGLEVEQLPRPIDWRGLFGNDHPVEMEIGMGKGTFIPIKTA